TTGSSLVAIGSPRELLNWLRFQCSVTLPWDMSPECAESPQFLANDSAHSALRVNRHAPENPSRKGIPTVFRVAGGIRSSSGSDRAGQRQPAPGIAPPVYFG